MSSIYPLVFTYPIENGLQLLESQTTNIVMCGVVAEGVLTMLVGILMELVHVNMLFVSLSFMAMIMWLLRLYC